MNTLHRTLLALAGNIVLVGLFVVVLGLGG